jgi:phosphatidyl-myo-inositol dimannoside synthase
MAGVVTPRGASEGVWPLIEQVGRPYLRLLLITPDFPPRLGGIQVLAHRLATHFQYTTTQVHTLDTEGAGKWDMAQTLDVRRVPVGRDRRLALVRLNAAAVKAAWRFRADVVLAMHIVAAPAAAAIQRILGVPTVTYLHAREVSAAPGLARFAVQHSSQIVAVSRYTAGLAVGAGADPQRIAVIPPGVDWRELPTGERLPTPTVVTVARIEDSYKGHDVMVRAMPLVRSRIPETQWVVVGDGSRRRDIERLAALHGVNGAIRMCGAVDDAERDWWLDHAHVFAMPSRTPASGGAGEGFGIVYSEAGVHGLPVVGGRAGGALDAVVDGSTGLLVDPGDHVQVADAISRLLMDRQLAARMGAAGSEHARGFAWAQIAGRVENLIAEAVRRS